MRNTCKTPKHLARKLKDKRGETIVETLAALLVIVLAFSMLCGAIVTAARINASIDPTDTGFSLSAGNVASANVSVEVNHVTSAGNTSTSYSDTNTNIAGRIVHESDNANEGLYYYYESN